MYKRQSVKSVERLFLLTVIKEVSFDDRQIGKGFIYYGEKVSVDTSCMMDIWAAHDHAFDPGPVRNLYP